MPSLNILILIVTIKSRLSKLFLHFISVMPTHHILNFSNSFVRLTSFYFCSLQVSFELLVKPKALPNELSPAAGLDVYIQWQFGGHTWRGEGNSDETHSWICEFYVLGSQVAEHCLGCFEAESWIFSSIRARAGGWRSGGICNPTFQLIEKLSNTFRTKQMHEALRGGCPCIPQLWPSELPHSILQGHWGDQGSRARQQSSSLGTSLSIVSMGRRCLESFRNMAYKTQCGLYEYSHTTYKTATTALRLLK